MTGHVTCSDNSCPQEYTMLFKFYWYEDGVYKTAYKYESSDPIDGYYEVGYIVNVLDADKPFGCACVDVSPWIVTGGGYFAAPAGSTDYIRQINILIAGGGM